jgi:glycosyltransferase involved in cell wall biosynthesis|tara:strand:- start:280217 stop:281242 length:1026 start_codon:yes stop_codon:yes gene_type:complete
MKRKHNILYIGNKLSKKGATVTSIETLGAFLQREGYQVITVSSKKNKVLRLLDMMWNTLCYSKRTSIVLIDTYSTTNFLYAVIIGSICRTLGLPYIPILRGGNLPSRLQKSSKQSNKLFGNAMTNVAPSHYLLEAFKKEGYTNLTYIPNTIEIEKYSFLFRKNIKPKLLWVRSFSEIYNPMLALYVVEGLLKNGHTNTELCMVGPDKDGSMETCKAYAKQKNLPVTFTGGLAKKEWLQLSKDYDIFINTTHVDNTPVSVIEAMALGLPVISTHVGGIPYLLTHDETGVLVPPNSVANFVTAIERILQNPEETTAIAIKARKTVEKFDWEEVKKQWITVLQK